MDNKYLEFLTRVQAADESERPALLLEFSLAQLSPKIRAAVEAAAIPHFFDKHFLNALLADSLTEAEFQELTQLSFIEAYPKDSFFNVHEKTRLLLLDKLWKENPDNYREISQRAFQYCQQQDQESTTWRIETLYHQVIAEPEIGVDELYETARKWNNPPNFAYDKIEVLTRTLHEHIDDNRLNTLGKHTVLYWEGVIDSIYSRPFDAKTKLQQINLTLETRDYLKANCLWRLGNVHLNLSELREARGQYEQALPIFRQIGKKLGEANCLKRLGDIHLRLSELGKAQGLYEQALSIFHLIGAKLGEANCLQGLGDAHLSLSELVETQGLYEQALLIYRLIGAKRGETQCLRSLGDVYLRLSELEEARRLYEQTLSTFRLIGEKIGEANCLLGLGEVCLKQTELERAEKLIKDAQCIYQAIHEPVGQTDSLKMLGLLAIQTGEYASAQNYFEQAQQQFKKIANQEGIAETLEAFAELHTAQNHPDTARDYWQQAIALYEKLGMSKRADKCRQKI
ncbi:hypothetical protein BegalDRAFT_1545 [Beggiatoa alba B18LD]|uniref:Uncharacterized protein n=1 Tax=Beggiatoa alba B18LD TaxID=395493 RepID=I3CFN3_9GAMM|nr:tetratricopeptide repeat protein [Beggiatoa alba]EIJ42426.1 hypothetical protein BegalDRAFT_1545 [Beggiatoa alba B18LD]